MTTTREPNADDVLAAVASLQQTLGAALDKDWTALAGTLEWSCWKTLDHLITGTVFYAAQVANEAPHRLPPLRTGNAPDTSVEDMLATVGSAVHLLASALRAAPADSRAFHPAGMADPSGFAAMSCVEQLVHASDIAAGLGVDFDPPADVCERTVRRLFPWIEDLSPDPFSVMRWTTGRIELPGREDVAADWYWQCAPLAEWDGTIKKRPPAR